MHNFGLIGSGNIGTTVARLAIRAGYDVVLSNRRGPHTLTELIADLGPRASAGTTAQAAGCDIVVVTIPLKNLHDIDPGLLDGRIVIDTINYYPERDGRIESLDSGSITTSELVQQHLAGSRVVKGFNNIIYSHLAELPTLHDAPRRTALPIATDDSGAREAVTQLIDKLGFDVVDAGPIAEGWRFERGRPAYCAPYAADPQALSLSTPGNRPKETRVADAREIRGILEQTNR
jgi:predicted dinucleotide-binding enzyme